MYKGKMEREKTGVQIKKKVEVKRRKKPGDKAKRKNIKKRRKR
jgi:hypothetical protein